jgi:hypothetical protein
MGEVRGSIPFRAYHLENKQQVQYGSVMSDQRADLILEVLRVIRGDIGEIKADLVEVKQHLGLLEAQYASVSGRVDRMAGDIALIKRRLDLVEA